MGVPTMRLLQSLLVLAAVATFVAADTNVFGERLARCGSRKSCAYHAADKAAHEVCVRKLPRGFSAATGQGHWSDRFTGKKWCICIWAYSNYILSHHDLSINCDAIPAKVLDEKYSLDKSAQCGKMSSKGGCGPEDIRRSIDRICDQCSSEAKGNGKQVLDAKCAKIKSAAAKKSMALVQEMEEDWSEQ